MREDSHGKHGYARGKPYICVCKMRDNILVLRIINSRNIIYVYLSCKNI